MFKILIDPVEFENTIDLTPYVPIPLNISYRLDESLDYFSVSARNMPSEYNKPFRPFTEARFFYDDTQTYFEIFYISSDEVTRNIATNTYTHNITFIEETKILERVMSDTRMFQQPRTTNNTPRLPLINIPISIDNEINYTNYSNYVDVNTSNTFVPPIYKNNKFTIYSGASIMTQEYIDLYNESISSEYGTDDSIVSVSFDEINNKGDVVQNLFSSKDTDRNPLKYVRQTISLNDKSTYKITYDFYIDNYISGSVHYTYEIHLTQTFMTNFGVEDEAYTLYDVCQSILDTCTCRLEKEANQFSIANVSDASADYIPVSFLQNTISPEFTFSKSTLWEVFSIIGGYMNAIPKLYYGELYFEKMNKTSRSLIDYNYEQWLIGETSSWSNEQYCNTIESDVDNLVDNENVNEGSISEPNAQYYRTLRAESGTVQVTTDNSCFIKTDYPIAKIIKVECGYLPDNETLVGDITNYVYEQAEYNAYTGYAVTYPSKAMALTWTYGEHNITGLTFKAEQAWANAFGLDLFNNYSIINIISNVTGKPVDILKQAFTNAYDMRYLQFRVTYIPLIDARVRQHKSSINENFGYNNIIQYNQTANIISSEHYGENIKGAVNRFGNDEIVYNLLIPKSQWSEQNKRLGVKWLDTNYIISQIDVSYYDDVVRLDVHLSKNFNRYSQYVGIDNQFRMYEVSERQAVERDVIYEEYIAVTYDDTSDYVGRQANIVEQYCLSNILNSFVNDNVGQNIDSAILSTYDKNNDMIASNIILPVVSVGIGNALYFKFRFNDNYSAGDRVVPQLVNGVLYDEQVYVPYSDYYGKIHSMAVSMGRTGIPSNLNFDNSYLVGNSLPQNLNIFNNDLLNFATNNKVVLEKTGSEIITFSTQINFVSDDTQDLIIGSGLTHTNSLTSKQTNNYRVYVLPYKLNSNTLYIDVSNLTPLDDVGFSSSDISVTAITGAIKGSITKTYTYSGSVGLSWAIVDKNTGYFILGRNMYIQNGTVITFPNFYPCRSLVYKRSNDN